MAFRFALQPLLRLRQSYEDRERLHLAVIVAHLNRLHAQLEALEREKREAWDTLTGRLQSGVLAAELHFEQTLNRLRERRRRELLVEIEKAEAQRRRQEHAFLESRRSAKVLENLCDRQLALWRQEQARREQRHVDDLFALNRHAGRKVRVGAQM